MSMACEPHSGMAQDSQTGDKVSMASVFLDLVLRSAQGVGASDRSDAAPRQKTERSSGSEWRFRDLGPPPRPASSRHQLPTGDRRRNNTPAAHLTGRSRSGARPALPIHAG